MALIDKTYFKGEYLIPNVEGVGLVATAAGESLDWYIAKYDPEYLRLVLGETLYDALISGLAITPVPAKWAALRNVLVDSTNKLSYIAGYVYYFVERSRFSLNTSQGQAKAKAQNSENVINTAPMRKAYNESMEYGRNVRAWLTENLADYPEYTVSELKALKHLIPW